MSAHALEALTGLTRWSIPHFQLDEAERDRALNWLRHVGYRGGPILAVHTGAGHPIRCWGDENFNAVLKALPGAVQVVTVIDDGSRKGGQDIRVPNTVPSCVWRGGFAGVLVPEALRYRWRLHRGVSKRVLPKLLPQLGNVDIFVHDSLHTSHNMCWEFQSVAPYLGPRSVVIADDVDENSAFHDWVTRKQPVFCATIEKPDIRRLFGVSLFLDAHSSRP